MTILGSTSALANVGETWDTAINDNLLQRTAGVAEKFTDKETSDGTSHSKLVMDSTSVVAKLVGSRPFYPFRSYRKNTLPQFWTKNFSIGLLEATNDRTGMVGKHIAAFAASVLNDLDKIIIDGLLTNPVSHDAAALLSDSHVNVGGSGTSDNLTTSALTFATFEAAYEALLLMKNEAGDSLGVVPDTLLVGPAQAREAMMVTGAERPTGFAGDQSVGTGTAIAAVSLPNYLNTLSGGACQVLISPHITGAQWFLMDTKGSGKPMSLIEFLKPEAVLKNAPSDDCVYYRQSIEGSITYNCNFAAGDWHRIYGSVTA